MNEARFKRIIVYAPNIRGGGAILLQSLIEDNIKINQTIFITDLSHSFVDHLSINKTNIKVIHCSNRIQSELRLKKIATKSDLVLCFSNIPPILRIPSKVKIFIQNRFLLDRHARKNLHLLTKIKINILKAILSVRLIPEYSFIVQTYSMKSLLEDFLKRDFVIDVLPFAQNIPIYSGDKNNYKTKNTFFYPSSFLPHKNHINLIKAWDIMVSDGMEPKLYLTISDSEFESIIRISKVSQKLKKFIILLGSIDIDTSYEYYHKTCYLIFPSYCESFGMPLIEAKKFGNKVIASELDYVRDIIIPDETFDPSSPKSIARAVKRVLNINQKQTELLSPAQFLENILE